MRNILALALIAFSVPAFVQAADNNNAPKNQQAVLETNPNQKQLEAAVYSFFAAVQSMDGNRLAAVYMPNGTLEDPVGTAPIQGSAAIGQFFEGLQTAINIGRITPRVKDMFVGAGNSTEVAVRWELTGYTNAGKQVILQGIGIFKFRLSPGRAPLLESVREFWDPVQLTAQVM